MKSDPRSLKAWMQNLMALLRRRDAPDFPKLQGAVDLRKAVAGYPRQASGEPGSGDRKKFRHVAAENTEDARVTVGSWRPGSVSVYRTGARFAMLES